MLNVEKVVNPPQMPVEINNFQLLLMYPPFKFNPITMPINKLPTIFIKQVVRKIGVCFETK